MEIKNRTANESWHYGISTGRCIAGRLTFRTCVLRARRRRWCNRLRNETCNAVTSCDRAFRSWPRYGDGEPARQVKGHLIRKLLSGHWAEYCTWTTKVVSKELTGQRKAAVTSTVRQGCELATTLLQLQIAYKMLVMNIT